MKKILVPTSKSLRLYLIRHGETEWSVSGRHTGRTDLPLTLNGESQAQKLGKHLHGISFSHVLSSPLLRARQTCGLVGLDKEPEIDADLIEWDYGNYEGRSSADIRKERPNWTIFWNGCPNGELPAQILGRADRLIARLRLLDGNIALFSHGQIGAVVAARWIGLPLIDGRHFPLDTASLSILGYDHHHPEVSVIAAWNATLPEIEGKEALFESLKPTV